MIHRRAKTDPPPIRPNKVSRNREIKIYGKHACQAAWKIRAQDLIRVYISHALVKEFGDCLRFCAKRKIAYHIVADDELARITESSHHEGICFLVKRREELGEKELLEHFKTADRKISTMLLYLDGVSNPHNFGSIARLAAHYGVRYILGGSDLPKFSGSATRVAQGGAEAVSIVRLSAPETSLKKMSMLGFKVIATSSRKGANLYGFNFPKRTVLIIGAEGQGISREIEKLSDSAVNIPGTGAVESLNVSSATGILLSEWWRQVNVSHETRS